MDYVKPIEVVKAKVAAGDTKAGLSVKDLLIRGLLSGALLGFATSLAFTAAAQTGVPLGLELVTGGFAVVMLAGVNGRRQWPNVLANLNWVYIGNLIGGFLFTGLFPYWTYKPVEHKTETVAPAAATESLVRA